MEFNSLEDIRKYLVQHGFFYTKNGVKLKPHIKVGDSIEDIKELLPIQELRMNEIVHNAVVNPLVLMDDVKLRKLAINIDYRTIDRYNKMEAESNKLSMLQKELKKCEYIYIKDKKQYYKIKDKRLGKSGLFIIDKELIPENKDMVSYDNYNTIKKAFYYEKTPNKYKEEYQLELDKFNSLNVCNW